MSDTKKKIITPVNVEYNITSDRVEFNVFENTQTLLELLLNGDIQFRILDAEQNVVLLEQGTNQLRVVQTI